MTRLDLSDFLILKEIYRTRSITTAVARVGLSQPSISIRLSHIRQHFDDPLFVRTAEGMMPTPRLESLLPAINQALELLQPEGTGFNDFQPEQSDRVFRISFSDVAQIVVLPKLLTLIERHAPKIRLDAAYLDERTGRSLESGETDLAMGYAIELHAGVYQQRLLTEHYVCIVRARHPRVDAKLTARQFLAEAHVAVVVPGTGYSILDKELAANGMQRKVRVRVQSFVALQEIIIATDLLAVVPARLADSMAASRRIRALPIPGSLPSYEVRQYWHERYHRDPGNRWIRQLIFDTFAGPTQSGEIAPPG